MGKEQWGKEKAPLKQDVNGWAGPARKLTHSRCLRSADVMLRGRSRDARVKLGEAGAGREAAGARLQQAAHTW